MKNNKLYSFTILIILAFSFVRCALSQKEKQSIKGNITSIEKQKGAHVFGRMDTSKFQKFKEDNLEWITLVAWGHQENHDSPTLGHHRGDSLQMVKRDSSWLSRIEIIRAAGFKVFVKPHIWLQTSYTDKWRSDIFHKSEEDWNQWSSSYRDFILRYARIAEKGKAELFCVGVELTRLSLEKSDFWEMLIEEVRSIYSGELTYAANWHNEFENITFWDQLDYIGIQAYFPVAENKFPTVEQVSKGWQKHLPMLEAFHKKYDRKILFTEMGYKSTASCAVKPWEWIEEPAHLNHHHSLESQANCYIAFFETVWPKNWFAGVHLWQYRFNPEDYGDSKNMDFTPQGKPAEEIIKRGFKRK